MNNQKNKLAVYEAQDSTTLLERNTLESLSITYTANVRFKLRISHNRK